MNQLFEHLKKINKNEIESVRLFHGRGKKWDEYKHLSIDFYPPYILIATYKEMHDEEKKQLTGYLLSLELKVDSILLQKRYLKNHPVEIMAGEIPVSSFAIEDSEKYFINLKSSQNIGFFLDMSVGRKKVKKISKNKKVLNLFSYTCSLSVAAMKGGALEVVNVDMSKSALRTGEKNHEINGIDMRAISFLNYDIMKSLGKIAKKGPYDLIILDPPTNQGKSFKAQEDYCKIIKRLPEMVAPGALIMACINSPHLDSSFLLEMFFQHAPQFIFQEKMYSSFSSMEKNPEEGLKILWFMNG